MAREILDSRSLARYYVKMFKQVPATPAHVKGRFYPKTVAQGGDAERYCELKFRIDETIFAAYDKAEMRKAKILVIARSDFVHTCKPLFWTDVLMLAETDLDWMQGTSMAIGFQRQTEVNPITIVFAGKNDHLHCVHSGGRCSVSSNQIHSEVLKVTPKPLFVLSPGCANLSAGLKFVYSMIAQL